MGSFDWMDENGWSGSGHLAVGPPETFAFPQVFVGGSEAVIRRVL
jgi:hypothetical protein